MASELIPVPQDLGFEPTIRGLEAQQRVFDRYLLRRILGRGGMGIVWLCQDERLEREVALKFLPDVINFDPVALDDLKRETRRCLELTHPNIIRIYDFVQDEQAAAISMEFVDGETLAGMRIEKSNRVFEVADLRGWMIKACQALHYAHAEVGVVHRDLKPANFMVNRRGHVKVADFGISQSVCDSMSRRTMRGSSSGTLAYMSPQQLNGEKAKPSDDIYALGATIYEMLTGKPPFHSGDVSFQVRLSVPMSMAAKRQELEVVGEPIPQAWEEAIAACLAKIPEERPASMADLAERLRQAGPTRRLPIVPAARPRLPVADRMEQTQKRAAAPDLSGASVLQKNKWVLSGVAGLILLGGATMFLPRPRPPAENPTTVVRPSPPPVVDAAPVIPNPIFPPVKSIAATPTPPAKPVDAEIRVASNPPGALVHLDGRTGQPTPAFFQGIAPGTYHLTISADGYEPQQQEVTVAAGAKIDLGTLALVRLSGNLNLGTVPDHAHYVLAGTGNARDVTREGTTPEYFDSLPIGTYQLTISRTGSPTYTGSVEVQAHATIVLKADLTELSLAAGASPNTARVIRGEMDPATLNPQERTELAGLENQAFNAYLAGNALACASGELQKIKALGVDTTQQDAALATRQLTAETKVATQLRKLIHEKKWATACQLFSTLDGAFEKESMDRLNAEFQAPIAHYEQEIAGAIAQSKSVPAEAGYLQIKALIAQYPSELNLQLALGAIAEHAAPDHARLTDLTQVFRAFAKANKDEACQLVFTEMESAVAGELQQFDVVAGALAAAKEGTPDQKRQLAELEERREIYENRRIGSPDKNNPFSAAVNFFGKAVTGHAVVNNHPYFESRREEREAIDDVQSQIDALKASLVQPPEVIDAAQKNYDTFVARVPWGQ